MKLMYCLVFSMLVVGCTKKMETPENLFLVKTNVPIDYAKASAKDIEEYAKVTLKNTVKAVEVIKQIDAPTFENVFVAMDDMYNKTSTASNILYMLYWVSPDSLSRINGLAGYQLLDSLTTNIYSDKAIYNKMISFRSSSPYNELKGNRKLMVDDLILQFEQSGVNLTNDKLTIVNSLIKEISQLSSQYSENMNKSAEILTLDEQGAEGLPENFKNTYKTGTSKYEIPIINATRDPVLKNASREETRKAYYIKFNNRAADKNMTILDSLIQKRYELGQTMGSKSYAEYTLKLRMAKNPETVWSFINDLVDRSKEKAKADIELLKAIKQKETASKNLTEIQSWDIPYYNNEILKTKWNVDNELIRNYLPMEQCLKGVFDIYQKLLGLEFRKVENPSVWHKEVSLYEVFEGNKLKGRFYLDLFPRPNKESWFYGVQLSPGKATADGYEVPCSMLLGNFTRPTATLPSLLSHSELRTLFHEFGHIMNAIAYHGEFALQSGAKADFVESMSQIFENWIWDYESLSSFSKNYKTGEVLPKEIFDNMINARNLSSGLGLISSLRSCIYDMEAYDKYDPKSGLNTDELWKKIDTQLGIMPMHVEGTHPQASWIHINTHPVYYYGYLWSKVYAQDMFTEFEKNGLTSTETGIRYRELILANGSQRDIVAGVQEFLGRPSNNEAYIRSLGLK